MTTAYVATESERLVYGYQICVSTEGNSPAAIRVVKDAIKYFQRFLDSHCPGMPLTAVTAQEIRAYTYYLQHKQCYLTHPTTPVQDRLLSGHTVNTYVRSLRAFYSWLVSEEIIQSHPFTKVKIPRCPKRVVATFSPSQLRDLLGVINTNTRDGYRNQAIILTMLDTGLRLSELCGMKMDDLSLEDGMVKVLGKGNKERTVPIGRRVQRLLWHYIEKIRPQSMNANRNFLFLTHCGHPLSTRGVQIMLRRYGLKARLVGVRCSPHTLRHTAAITFLRNGGDVFSLQRLLGHSNLEMTRRYSELATVDVKKAHIMASPVDNLDFNINNRGHNSGYDTAPRRLMTRRHTFQRRH